VFTGFSKGIGKAIALEFANKGYRVVLNARVEREVSEALNDVRKTLKDKEERITWQEIYLRKTFAHLDHTIKTFGRIDVLVNNAGIGGAQKQIHELTTAEWEYVIDVNLKGAF
jgi:NAD(P)-dependent dehydrogenase (short-subunit alcohol dehydrogenase family)